MDMGLRGQAVAVLGSGSLADRCAALLAHEGATIAEADGSALAACAAVVAIAPRSASPHLDAVDDDAAFAAWDHVVDLAGRLRAATDGMVERGYGRVVWVGPLDAKQRGGQAEDLDAVVGLGALGLIKAMAGEFGPRGITCNSVLWDGGDLEAAAAAVVFLASRPSGYVSGVALAIDGARGVSLF